MSVPKNVSVSLEFSELVSCDHKRLGKAVLITFWGDVFQEYYHFCEDPQSSPGVFRRHRLTKNWKIEFRKKENKIKQTKSVTRFENLPSQFEATYEKVLYKAIKTILRPEKCK